MLSDDTLLQRYAGSRDEAAFRELVGRHVDAVYSTALRRVGGDRHLAEDVVQRVFVELARQSARLQAHPALGGWLFLTARNQAVMVVRAESRRRACEKEAETMNPSESGGQTEVDWTRLGPVVDGAIDQLRAADREAVVLRFFGRKTFAEIGECLRVSEDAARMRVDRALERLRVNLKSRGITSTSAALTLGLAAHSVQAAPAGLAMTVASAALQGPLVASGPLAVLKLMGSGKLVTGAVTGALILVSASLAVREHAARTAAERQLVAAQAARAETVQRRQAAERELAELQKQLTAATHDPAGEKPGSAVGPASLPPGWNPVAEGTAFMDRHPEVRQQLRAMADGETDFLWAELYRKRHFTPEQVARFRELVRSPGGFSRNLDHDGNNLVTLMNGTEVPDRAQGLKELLGPEGMREMVELGRASSARRLGAKIAGSLVFSDAPLTSEQANQVVRALQGAESRPGGRTSLPAYDWEQVTGALAGSLSAEQLAAVRSVAAKVDYDRAFSVKAQAARSAAAALVGKEPKP